MVNGSSAGMAKRAPRGLWMLAALALLWLHLGLLDQARGQASTCDQKCWREAMAAYAANPTAERGRLLALERLGTEALPPEILLLLADAHLRSGHDRAARELFERVSASDAPEPLHGWALLGGAWMAARSGDVDRALTLLGDANAGEHFEPAAVLLSGYLEAARGTSSGEGRLRDLLVDPRAPLEVQSAARMVLGLTYYWSGQPEQARESFQSVANDDGGGVLKDEATYAVARMMIAEGRMAEAKSLLERLAASEASLPQGKIPAGLLDLERRSLLRTGLKGYRRGALGAPAAQIVRLLDWNGAALAKALLARLERESRGDSVVQLATHAEPKETSDEIVDVSVPSGEGVRAWPAAQAETFPARPATAQAGASASGTQGLGLPLLGLALAIVASGLVLRGRWARRSTKQ